MGHTRKTLYGRIEGSYMKKKMMFFVTVFIFGLSLSVFPNYVYSQGIPNVDFEVTVQQKSDGVLSKSYHLFTLNCWNNKCVLTSVSLNQCFPSSYGRNGYFPKVESHSTGDGELEVRKDRNSLIVKYGGVDFGGEYTTTLQFVYEPTKRKDVAPELIGFSGGYIKNLLLDKKTITTSYVPLSKKNTLIKMDCDVLLPGIEKR